MLLQMGDGGAVKWSNSRNPKLRVSLLHGFHFVKSTKPEALNHVKFINYCNPGPLLRFMHLSNYYVLRCHRVTTSVEVGACHAAGQFVGPALYLWCVMQYGKVPYWLFKQDALARELFPTCSTMIDKWCFDESYNSYLIPLPIHRFNNVGQWGLKKNTINTTWGELLYILGGITSITSTSYDILVLHSQIMADPQPGTTWSAARQDWPHHSWPRAMAWPRLLLQHHAACR